MNILITLYYNAELGGLHDNIFATALEAKKRGYNVFVACRAGVFNEKLSSHGIETITIDQDKKIDSINKIIDVMGEEIDLIHAHPGNSRIIAMRLHKKYDIPVIYHVHGSWLDGVERYIDEVKCVFAVSESVRQNVIRAANGFEEKVHVIPNYSEYYPEVSIDNNDNVISLIARLDPDKIAIIEEFYKLIPYLNKVKSSIKINIIGDGRLREEFIAYLNTHITNKMVVINYLGWINNKDKLRNLMRESRLIIGAGRVAIDGLALNKAVVVAGAKNYQGIINRKNWQSFISNNFGETGKFESDSNIVKDIDSLLNNEEVLTESIRIGETVIDSFFNKKTILEKHFNIYNIVKKIND